MKSVKESSNVVFSHVKDLFIDNKNFNKYFLNDEIHQYRRCSTSPVQLKIAVCTSSKAVIFFFIFI